MTFESNDLISTCSEKESEPVRYRMQCPKCGSTWERARDSKIVKQTRKGERICTHCEENLILVMDTKGLQPNFLAQITQNLDCEERVTIGVDGYGAQQGDIAETGHFDGGHYVVIAADIVEKDHRSPPDWVNVEVSKTDEGWRAITSMEVTIYDVSGRIEERYETDITLTEISPRM